MIKCVDNVFDEETFKSLHKTFLFEQNYRYGERDSPQYELTGMVSELNSQQFNFFNNIIISRFSELKNKKIQRGYVNLFRPNEHAYYHPDGNVTTCLFYINPEYDINEGGETFFIVDDEVRGVRSKPGRLVVFDGRILHRATPFRSYPRLTVALKYYN